MHLRRIAYYFDEASGALEGLIEVDDVPWGPCELSYYVIGTVNQNCDDTTICRFCDSREGGAAGAGAGGADGDGMCP